MEAYNNKARTTYRRNRAAGVYCSICGQSATLCGGTHQGNSPLYTASGWTIANLPGETVLDAIPGGLTIEADPSTSNGTGPGMMFSPGPIIEAVPSPGSNDSVFQPPSDAQAFTPPPPLPPEDLTFNTPAGSQASSFTFSSISQKIHLPTRRIWWGSTWSRRIGVVVTLLVILVAIVFSANALFPPRPTVTVRIIPIQRTMSKIEQVKAVLAKPSPQEVAARIISVTTPTKSATATATGKGYTQAISAKGILTLTNQASTGVTIAAGTTYTGQSGMTVVTDAPVQVPPVSLATNPPTLGEAQVDAHTQSGGAASNIAARDIDICCSGGIAVRNLSAFWGGKDGQPYPILQTSDIQAAARPLQQELTTRGTTDVRSQVTKEVQLAQDPHCTPTLQSDQGNGAHVTSTTVRVTMTCVAEVYPPGQVKERAWTHFREHPSFDKETNMELQKYTSSMTAAEIQQATISDATQGTVTLTVWIQGIWVHRLESTQRTWIATHLAGKNKSQAGTILSEAMGIKQATFIWQPDGQGRFPTDPASITIEVIQPKLPVPPQSSG